jgi:hypothetical protein
VTYIVVALVEYIGREWSAPRRETVETHTRATCVRGWVHRREGGYARWSVGVKRGVAFRVMPRHVG